MIHLDVRPWLRRVRVFKRRRTGARENALRKFVGIAVRQVVREAPRDTGRYVRGWALAGRDVGADVQVPPLRASRDADWRRQRLVGQFVGLSAKLEAWYGSVNGGPPTNGKKPDKWYRRLIKARRRAHEELQKFTETSVFVYGRQSAKTLIARLDTVRSKVYGGRGRILSRGDRSVAELKNLEPHASIVESRHGGVRRAVRSLRALGVKQVGRQYVKAVDVGPQ